MTFGKESQGEFSCRWEMDLPLRLAFWRRGQPVLPL
jgi:hypothetical protein